MINRKIVSCLFILFVLSAVSVIGDEAVSLESAPEYLESGDFSYNIEVNFSRIARHSVTYYTQKKRELSQWLEENPGDPERVITCLDFLTEAGFSKDASELAERYIVPFRDLFQETKAAEPAHWYMKAANALDREEHLAESYEGVRPFLESANAPLEMVLTALENREKTGSYELALKIAGFYFTVYPEEPELFFQTFLISMAASLYETVPRYLEESAALISPGENGLDEEELEEFFIHYLSGITGDLYLDLLDRAITLDPDNYQYRLASAGFRTLLRWFSQLRSLAFLPRDSVSLRDVQRAFSKADPQITDVLLEDLEKGLELRPLQDVEILLTAALASASRGETGKTRTYAEQAMAIRPDIPRCYDALLFARLYENIHRDDPFRHAGGDLIQILKSKEAAGLASAYDFYVLAALKMEAAKRIEASERTPLLKEMESYAKKSLEIEKTWYGYLVLGNALLLQSEFDTAREMYNRAESAGTREAAPLARTNIGILYALEGKRDEAIALLRAALEDWGESEKARSALRELTR